MNIQKFILENFECIWNTNCGMPQIGYKILNKETFSTESVFPILWGYNGESGIKVLVFLWPMKNSFIPYVFVDVDSDKRKNVITVAPFPRVLKHKFNNIGELRFTKMEIKELSKPSQLHKILGAKCKNVDVINCLEKTNKAINSTRQRRKRDDSKKPAPRSVYTISAGLYGLGKNRKH